jgi:FAD/FMN-containing dehydrogenase
LVAHLGAASALDVRDAYLATGGSDGRIAVWRVADLPTSAASATEPFAEATFAGTVDALVWIDDATLAAAVTEGRRSRVVRLRLRDRR